MKPTYIDFDSDKFKKEISSGYTTRGEIGVLSYPYSKKISQLWQFKTPELAATSSKAIYKKCSELIEKAVEQLENNSRSDYILYNFVRADICRKFLLMGYTRSMRYYYHKSGTKWGKKTVDGKQEWFVLPYDYDPTKLDGAKTFKEYHDKIYSSANYKTLGKWFKDVGKKLDFDYNRV